MVLSKFDKVKMAELVKVEEIDQSLVLTFQGDVRVTIKVVDNTLVSEVS